MRRSGRQAAATRANLSYATPSEHDGDGDHERGHERSEAHDGPHDPHALHPQRPMQLGRQLRHGDLKVALRHEVRHGVAHDIDNRLGWSLVHTGCGQLSDCLVGVERRHRSPRMHVMVPHNEGHAQTIIHLLRTRYTAASAPPTIGDRSRAGRTSKPMDQPSCDQSSACSPSPTVEAQSRPSPRAHSSHAASYKSPSDGGVRPPEVSRG